MHPSTLFTVAAALTAVQGAVLKRDVYTLSENDAAEYFYDVCFAPKSQQYEPNGTEIITPDINIPCEAVQIIQNSCAYGPDNNGYGPNAYSYGDNNMAEASPRDEQICICESQFFDQLSGCVDCISKHGFNNVPELSDELEFSPSFTISSFSRSYCAATNTPTTDFADIFGSAAYGSESTPASSGSGAPTFSEASTYNSLATLTITDPIGNKTDVSYYFTPSVTGAAITQVSNGPLITPTSNSRAYLFSTSSSSVSSTTTSSGTASSLSMNTNSAGQIVPTAGSAASSTKSGAAIATAVADKMAVAGVLGLAAVVAIL